MLKIIKAIDNDREFLSMVCQDAAKLYDSILPGAFDKQAKKFIDKGLPDAYEIEIIKQKEENIGFIGTTGLDEDTLYITAIYILSPYQGKGYGTEILEAIEGKFCDKGIKKLALLVHSKATWAINFYKKKDFTIVETEPEKIKEYSAHRMAKYFLPETLLMVKTIAL